MSYVICKEPGIQIDLMVKKEYQPQLVGYVERMGCTYKKEVDRVIKGINEEWVTLKNVESVNGLKIGQLIGLFYNMDWQALNSEGRDDKFYILIHKVRGKKNGGRNWKKADSGSKGRIAKGSAEAVRHEGCVGVDGSGTDGGPCGDGAVCAEQAE